jgi:hypothetical protein
MIADNHSRAVKRCHFLWLNMSPLAHCCTPEAGTRRWSAGKPSSEEHSLERTEDWNFWRNTRVASPPSSRAHLLFKGREITGQPMNGSRQVLSAVPASRIPDRFRPQAAHHRIHRDTRVRLSVQ